MAQSPHTVAVRVTGSEELDGTTFLAKLVLAFPETPAESFGNLQWLHPAIGERMSSGHVNVGTVAPHFGAPLIPGEATVDLVGRPGDVHKVIGILEKWFQVVEQDELEDGPERDVRLRIVKRD